MFLGVVGDSISEIMERVRSLPGFGHNSTSITENINGHLLTIKQAAAKPEQNNATRKWLGQVTDVVSDLWDFLEDLDLPAGAALLQKQSKIASLFSFCNLTPPSPVLQLKEMEKRLGEVAAAAPQLPPRNVEKLINTDAEKQEIQTVGRDYDKEQILDRILREKNVEGAVPVVVIVGIGGIGKTKLAKFVYDDEQVNRDFDLMVWIDGMHEQIDDELAVQRMIESASKKKPQDKDSIGVVEENLNLREAINGSRFFLVLDDFRNESRQQWRRLHQRLTEAATPNGGAVLITTQSDIVANIVDPVAVRPSRLDLEDSWSLFDQVAGESSEDDEAQMLEKCGGVPAAIITMARMLSSRGESETYQLENEFMQEMQLRYFNELSSWHLKQCLAYSSFIFSAAKSVNSDTLIRLWMAEGFLRPINSSCEPEDLGRDYIQELRRKSIFSGYEDEYGILRSCSMNDDLMKDLSAFLAGNYNLTTDDPDKVVKEGVPRVLLTSCLDVSNGIPKSLSKADKNLRTILLPADSGWALERVPYEVKLSWSACDAIFSGFKRLRVLILQDLGMKMLPSSIGDLTSLRYLDLSKNNMKKLPNTIGELKHLQTLILSHCHELRELPNGMNHLLSLMHLTMEACLHLTHMPSALKKMTSLQTLSHFVASTSKKNHHAGGLAELTNLNNLRGKLEISHLERLKFNAFEQDGHANLKEKSHLERLTLRWNHDDEDDDNHDGQNTGEDSQSPDYDQISLGQLEPHPNLLGLNIVGYEGKNFSDWLSSLKCLVTFSLYNCSRCKSVPPLDQLPKLKILKLERLDSLEYVTDQDVGCNEVGSPAAAESFFPSLKELEISDCPNLTSWWKSGTDDNIKPSWFPSLSKLRVQYCPELDCMPWYPNLDDRLVLEGSLKPLQDTIIYNTALRSDSDSSPLSKLEQLEIANIEEQSFPREVWRGNFTSLKDLWIRDCKGLKYLMMRIKHLSSLESLDIRKCTEVDLASDEWEGLKSLRHLYMVEIPRLDSLPAGIEHLTSLEFLTIERCPDLTTLTEGIGNLNCLEYLRIEECHKLASLPEGMKNLKPQCTLSIRNCPLLLPRCQKETGDDWPHIKHIEYRDVKDTSEYD